jgi:hypothetical protein
VTTTALKAGNGGRIRFERMVARLLLALIAVLVLGWVAVLLRDYEIGHEAALRGYFTPKPTAAGRQDDLNRLEDAQLLNPDSYWKQSRASYFLLSRRPRSAAAEAEDIVRGEPDNLFAWSLLQQATERDDPARARQAAAEIRRLDPVRAR